MLTLLEFIKIKRDISQPLADNAEFASDYLLAYKTIKSDGAINAIAKFL